MKKEDILTGYENNFNQYLTTEEKIARVTQEIERLEEMQQFSNDSIEVLHELKAILEKKKEESK